MKRYLNPFLIMLTVLALGYTLWPLAEAHMGHVKQALIQFKSYCRANPWTSYTLYTGLLSAILLTGLPFASIVMLLAGVLYGFWEAAALVTICRLMAAFLSFIIVRHWLYETPPLRRREHLPYFLQLFERHPNIGLLLVRLAPLPDSMVNYTVAASPITHRNYLLVSLLGMIPVSIAIVWIGQELGSISRFIRYID